MFKAICSDPDSKPRHSIHNSINFYQPGARFTCAWLVLGLLYIPVFVSLSVCVCVCVGVCSSAIITCAKLCHSVTMLL